MLSFTLPVLLGLATWFAAAASAFLPQQVAGPAVLVGQPRICSAETTTPRRRRIAAASLGGGGSQTPETPKRRPRKSRKKKNPRQRSTGSQTTWRVFGVEVHPDRLAEDPPHEDDEKLLLETTRFLHPAVLEALAARLKIETKKNNVRLVRRSLDARSHQRRADGGTGPRFVYVLDVEVAEDASNIRWKHQPGRMELMKEPPEESTKEESHRSSAGRSILDRAAKRIQETPCRNCRSRTRGAFLCLATGQEWPRDTHCTRTGSAGRDPRQRHWGPDSSPIARRRIEFCLWRRRSGDLERWQVDDADRPQFPVGAAGFGNVGAVRSARADSRGRGSAFGNGYD